MPKALSEERPLKFQFVLPTADMDEIDDLRWRLRISSRSEVVRRLIRAGIDALNQQSAGPAAQ